MKKSLTITSVVAAALLAGACGPNLPEDSYGFEADDDTSYCADKSGKRVSDSKCKRTGGNGAFMFMYLSRGQYVPAYGQSSRYASRKPAYGRSYTSPSRAYSNSVSRGISGSSARGFSAGG